MQTIRRVRARFRVTDDDIIIGKQKAVGNLTLGAERLTPEPGVPKIKPLGFQRLSITMMGLLDRALMP